MDVEVVIRCASGTPQGLHTRLNSCVTISPVGGPSQESRPVTCRRNRALPQREYGGCCIVTCMVYGGNRQRDYSYSHLNRSLLSWPSSSSPLYLWPGRDPPAITGSLGFAWDSCTCDGLGAAQCVARWWRLIDSVPDVILNNSQKRESFRSS